MGMILPFLWQMKPRERIWNWSLAAFHSAILHIAKLSVSHLHAVEVVSVITTNFHDLTNSRIPDTRANVPTAITSHLDGIVQAKSQNTINLDPHRCPALVNNELVVGKTRSFQFHLFVLLRINFKFLGGQLALPNLG